MEKTMTIESGVSAPDFTLNDQDGKSHTLSSYFGKPIVLFFYPRDNTPGCTTEVCNFRDDYNEYQGENAVLIGISNDTEKSHSKFVNKFELPFALLADVEKEVVNLYQVYGPKKLAGRKYEGIFRTTFLIDKNGNIAKVFEKVKPKIHSEEVIEAIRNLE
jgi:thioredoxin-dependent peroxiredoxin